MTKKPPQRVFYQRSLDSYTTRLKVFNEIMEGPNPLTVEEMKDLVRKRPGKYGFMEEWIKKMEADNG